MGKIEVEVKRYFAGLGYDGYSIKFPEGGYDKFQDFKEYH